jgi:TRAP-type mannitol/chloroaromatic compound transport system permease small subunit
MGKQSVKIIAAIMAGLLSIPAVFLVSLWYFWRMVQAEYASGARISTDGDTVTIPAVGVTTAWTVLLLAGVGMFLVMRIVRKRKRGAAVEQADDAVAAATSCRIEAPTRRRPDR